MSSLLRQNLLLPANKLDNNIKFKAEESKMLLFEQGLDLRVLAFLRKLLKGKQLPSPPSIR